MMTVQDFVAKWGRMQLKEMASAQSHLNDVCVLVGHPTPTECDPKGEWFTFEAPSEKSEGGQGRADVWYRGKFIWEYKGAHANLDKAYQQLLRYRESLGNPPLLITSDMLRIVIHTNFTGTLKQVHVVDLERLAHGDGLRILKRAFHDPESFRPKQTTEQITKATADTFVEVARTLQEWARASGRAHDPERLAHFLVRLLFCLFAEDMKLLPENVFTSAVKHGLHDTRHFEASLRGLFATMRTGGVFGFHRIREFDGGLFEDDYVPELPGDIPHRLVETCKQDWSGVDPSIFGILFERVIDESKRAQLGAHYTGQNDIMLVVEPVLMQPLRDEWQKVRRHATQLVDGGNAGAARAVVQKFADRLARIRVLDPASGSGNFLYVALRLLLDLQKEVIAFAARLGLGEIELSVSPAQLYGIEINPYAHELAQITVWIGYIQWRFENGFGDIEDPVLRPLENIRRMDAVLAYDSEGRPVEPEWPEADVIVGNPPFVGGKLLRANLKDTYVDDLFRVYVGRVAHEADYVCYWFEKARSAVEAGNVQRAGLLATQGIRGGANREVLERIADSGAIFMAWADRPWVLDGANVHVSLVGFDDGTEAERWLDGKPVSHINSDLTTAIDLTRAARLLENSGIAYMGDTKGGAFDVSDRTAQQFLAAIGNPNGRPNNDVVVPWANGLDITRRSRNMWIVDFGVTMTEEEAAQYEEPFEYVRQRVRPERAQNKRERYQDYWWLHMEARPGMREALEGLPRYIATPTTAKHRLFTWLDAKVLPDHALIVFARADDYFLGVLHARAHELWALRQGTQVREKESGNRYTPTTTFETYPFPWPPGQEPQDNERVVAIADVARELDTFRQSWLNPPGVGLTIGKRAVAKRTLTNLYNALGHYRAEVRGKQRSLQKWEREVQGLITLEEIEQLDHIHNALDRAVLEAYGWPHTLSDEQILERLLALNLARAKAQ